MAILHEFRKIYWTNLSTGCGVGTTVKNIYEKKEKIRILRGSRSMVALLVSTSISSVIHGDPGIVIIKPLGWLEEE